VSKTIFSYICDKTIFSYIYDKTIFSYIYIYDELLNWKLKADMYEWHAAVNLWKLQT